MGVISSACVLGYCGMCVALNQSFAGAKHLSVGVINFDKFSASGGSWSPGTSVVFQVRAVLMGH